MMKEINSDPYRITLAIMQLHKCTYSEAQNKLLELKLNFSCGELLKTSVSLQASLITSVNCGVRAFQGGISVNMPKNTPLLLNLEGFDTLNDLVKHYGGCLCDDLDCSTLTLKFGLDPLNDHEIGVVSNGWKGGVVVHDELVELNSNPDFATGGIAAGALSVGLAFLKLTNLSPLCLSHTTGISLWRPDLRWDTTESDGPQLKCLPTKFWILGLGHLGQAYLWNLACLPYKDKSIINFILNDPDSIEAGNLSAGLLCFKENIGKMKTRCCSEWLEINFFKTIIVERMYDEQTLRQNDEPFLALCGFDNFRSRLLLEKSGFEFIAEAALGGEYFNFDKINIHTFPNASKSPKDIWGKLEDSYYVELKDFGISEDKISADEKCGYQMMLGKAISTSFVGAFAGSLITAEILRSINGGKRYENIVIQFTDMKNRFVKLGIDYSYKESIKNGTVAC